MIYENALAAELHAVIELIRSIWKLDVLLKVVQKDAVKEEWKGENGVGKHYKAFMI